MNPMILALALFAVMYVLLLILSDKRWIVALATAAVFIILGILPLGNVAGAINWNVLMMLAGTMATVELFIQSNMPARMAEKLLQKVPNVQWAAVALSLFSGIISAFVDNVATVLMVAPVGLAVAKKLKTDPVPVIIAIAVSSNLQGAATLVGDTTSILLAGHIGMSFNDFFWFLGKPGIAWAVELGALLTVPVPSLPPKGNENQPARRRRMSSRVCATRSAARTSGMIKRRLTAARKRIWSRESGWFKSRMKIRVGWPSMDMQSTPRAWMPNAASGPGTASR